MDWSLLTNFVNTTKVAGWTRAVVGAGIAAAIAKWPGLSQYLSPETQAALGVAVSGIAVGVWSHIAKEIATDPPRPAPAVPASYPKSR